MPVIKPVNGKNHDNWPSCSKMNKAGTSLWINGILLPKLFWPTVRKNCSSDWEKLLIFDAEGQEFAKILKSLEQLMQTVKGQNIFWQQNAFLICSWRFLICNNLGQLEFKLKKILGFRNMQENLENVFFFYLALKSFGNFLKHIYSLQKF